MRFSKIFSAMLCIFILGIFAYPQIRESGAIQGNVTDKTGAQLPGVTITLTGTSLIGGARTFLTDSKGFYRFPSIPPGPYTVSAELAGFVKLVQEKIQLHAGVTLTVDFVLEESKIENEVLVTAVSPTIDLTSSTAAPVVMTDELLLATPAINSPDSGAKSFYDVLNLAPGVDYYQAYGSGYGSTNAYQMDGINNSGIVEPDYNIISEASVQSFGLPAEYGEFSGVVFNAITKSGSNKFSGLGEFRYNGKSWNSQNITGVSTEKLYDPSMKDTNQLTDQHLDIGLQLGGPILKDKLWFFIAGEYYASRKNPPGTTVRPKWYSPKLFAKLSFQVNPSNRVNLGYNYDNEKADQIVAGPQFTPEASLDNNYPGHVVNLNWTSIFSANTFLDFKLGYNHKNRNQLPTAGMDISAHYDLATGMFSENFPSIYQGQNRYLDLNAHLSHYVPEFLKGSHELKLGIEYRYAKEAQGGGYPGPDHTWYLDLGGQPYLAYQYENNYFLDKYFTILAGFAEDSWRVTKSLILNFGARLNSYRYRLPSPGPGVIFNTTALAPRLGLTYSLPGKKTVLKFHYGHYYDSFDSGFFYYADTRRPALINKLWDGSQYVEYYRAAGTSYSVDPNIKMPFMREYMAAVEHEIFKDASLSLTFFYRKLARAIGPINTLGQYEKVTIVNPGPDGIEGTGDDSTIGVWNQTNPGENAYLITNPRKGQSPAMIEEPEHHASGFQVVFNKRFTHRWQAMVSYAYSVAKGNMQRPPVADMGTDPNLFINESGPNARYSGQPHFFKVLGNVLLPLDINLGIYFYYISSHTYRPYFGTVLDQGYETIYAEPWGKYHVDPQRNVNLNLAKTFKLSNITLTLLGDVYNLLNSHDVRWDYDVFNGYGPYFGKIYAIQQPRTFRVGFRIMY
jgi:hypothetical protein